MPQRRHKSDDFGRPKPPNADAAARLARLTEALSADELTATTALAMLVMEDAIVVADLQAGLPAYAGYFDGIYANLGAMSTWIAANAAGAELLSITVFGNNGAMCIDIEPGNAVPSQAPGFYENPDHGPAIAPWFYMSAGDMTAVQDALANAGIPRSQYFLWSAHYGVGQHLCGPQTCGFGLSQADATQWASNDQFDTSIVQEYCFNITDPTLVEGETGPAVAEMQAALIEWQVPLPGGADGVFGNETLLALRAFQDMTGLAVDGICGPATWAQLGKDPSTFTYSAPTITAFTAGIHSFETTVAAPLHFGQPVPWYQVFVYKGSPVEANLVWKRTQQATSNTETFQDGGLQPNTPYTLHVVAQTPSGTNVRPFTYAQKLFKTGT